MQISPTPLSEAAALDEQSAAWTNLVVIPDAFVGRADELEQIASLLLGGQRWVTLCGPPGVGKSRLAREVAARLLSAGRWREVCWVELRTIDDAQRSLQLLAEALRIPLDDAEGPAQQRARLVSALSARGALLILDDADHLLGALDALVALVDEARDAQLIVTSRRPCEARDERVITLAPLSCEGADDEAMALMRARLGEARLGRAWDVSAWEACERLARALGGAPLALEIAAARLRQLPPARLLERVEAALAGSPSPLAALHATVALSWEMLAPWEQATLAQCAVCEPGFGAELIELCVPEARWPDAPPPLDTLEQLQRHALLCFLDDGALLRGDMTPTVRMYALERLRSQPEQLEQARKRHLSACAQLARTAYEAASGDRFHGAITALLGELANLRRAAATLDECAAPAEHISLWLGLALVLWRAGDLGALREGMSALRAQMERVDEAELEPQLLCAGWRLCAELGQIGWERAARIPFMERSLHHAQAHGEQLWAHLALAQAHGELMNAEEAAHHLAQAQLLLKRAPDLRAEAKLRFVEGDMAIRREQLREALASMREAAMLASQAGAPHIRARALTSLSFASQSLGMVEETTAALREAHDIFEEQGDLIAQCHTLRLLAWYCVDEQRAEQAREASAALLAIGQRHAIGWARGFALLLQGHIELDAQHSCAAALAYEQALIALKRDETWPLVAAAALYLSLALEAEQQWERARERFEEAFALIEALRSPWARAYLRCVRAVWAVRDQDVAAATRQLELAASASAGSDSPFHEPMLALYTCALDALSWEQAQRAGKTRLEHQRLKTLLERLGAFMRVARPMLSRSLELRVALRHIQQRLPAWLRARLALEMDDPSGVSLLLDDDILAYRAPGQDAWVDMSKRPTPMRLLLALAAYHAAQPGAPLSAEALCERVWPGERILPEAATNRLYVTIAGLRRDGLREVILNVEGGYILASGLRVLAARR